MKNWTKSLLGLCAVTLSLVLPVPLRAASLDPPRRVNAPYFDGDVRYSEMAVFWFGYLDSTSNFSDVRIGYNDTYLRVEMSIFDRYLWYDPSPEDTPLDAWDAGTLYLDIDGDGGGVPAADDYRFVGQLNWWETGDQWQAAYRGDGDDWVPTSLPFTVTSGWRGNAPNDSVDDRGWVLRFYVPFESLGLSGPPSQGTAWRMGTVLHDRDDAAGTPIGDQAWPETFSSQRPESWGELVFGLPSYAAPQAIQSGTVTVREGLNGALVPDAAVGGTVGNMCPGDPYTMWNVWANANFGSGNRFNIQNLGDISDWPCFAKYYVTFPLDAIPAGEAVLSATLTLHKVGGADISLAQPSLIQVLTISDPWDEATVTWNNAPLAAENIAQTWVDPVTSEYPTLPGEPSVWDVSQAVADAYAAGTPVSLVLYEADWAYHSGKYFLASEEEDYYAEGRPTLEVTWGDPVGTVDLVASADTVASGDTLTYTLSIIGSGQFLTLDNELPEGVSAPVVQDPGLQYSPHQLTWTGIPAVGERVELVYAVTVTADSTTDVVNRASLTQADGLESSAVSVVLVDPIKVYLPLVLRYGG